MFFCRRAAAHKPYLNERNLSAAALASSRATVQAASASTTFSGTTPVPSQFVPVTGLMARPVGMKTLNQTAFLQLRLKMFNGPINQLGATRMNPLPYKLLTTS